MTLTNAPGSPRLATLVAWLQLLCLVTGAGLASLSALSGWQQWQAQHWPGREATVTAARVHERRHPGSTRRSWHAEVCVRFIDDGTQRCIESLRYGTVRLGASRAAAEADMAPYTVGRRVSVHVQPHPPARAVLEPHASARPLWLTGLAAGLLLTLGLGATGLAARRQRSNTAP